MGMRIVDATLPTNSPTSMKMFMKKPPLDFSFGVLKRSWYLMRLIVAMKEPLKPNNTIVRIETTSLLMKGIYSL